MASKPALGWKVEGREAGSLRHCSLALHLSPNTHTHAHTHTLSLSLCVCLFFCEEMKNVEHGLQLLAAALIVSEVCREDSDPSTANQS